MGNAILVRRSGVDVSEGTAMPNQVLTGSSFFAGENSDMQTGTMPNRGAVNQALNAGGVYTIPEGYHNGQGKVSAANLASQTPATATAGQILSGQTAYVNGAKVTGSMPNRGASNIVLPVNGNVVIPEGYHNGQGRVTQSIVTKGAQIYTPGTTNQTIVAGQYLSGVQTIAGDPNLKPENIAMGKTIFGVKGTLDFPVTKFQYVVKSQSLQTGYQFGQKINDNVSNGGVDTYLAFRLYISNYTTEVSAHSFYQDFDLTEWRYLNIDFGVIESSALAYIMVVKRNGFSTISKSDFKSGISNSNIVAIGVANASYYGKEIRINISELSGIYAIIIGIGATSPCTYYINSLYFSS